MIKLKVKVTKEILKESMMCGHDWYEGVSSNCAVALAIREIFPKVRVARRYFRLSPRVSSQHDGRDFINQFDALRGTPEKRLELPETVVTLDITDEIIDHLSTMIPNYEEVVNAQPHLELVTV